LQPKKKKKKKKKKKNLNLRCCEQQGLHPTRPQAVPPQGPGDRRMGPLPREYSSLLPHDPKEREVGLIHDGFPSLRGLQIDSLGTEEIGGEQSVQIEDCTHHKMR